MIQDINFWLQFICGLIVSRNVIAETDMGKKFLEIVLNIIKSCFTDSKANKKVSFFLGFVLFCVLDASPLITLLVLSAWLRIPNYIQEHKEEKFFKEGFLDRFFHWLGIAIGSWFFSSNPTSYIPFSWFLHITHNTYSIFIYGTISMIVLAILVDCIILYIALGLKNFIAGSGIFVFATIMFFVICPIVEHYKWNTFQDIVKSIEAKKESFSNRLLSLSNQQQESQIKEKTR